MAKIKHIALATQNVEETANFYKQVFDLEEVGSVDNENAEGRYLSDGNINLAILHFKNEIIAGQEFSTSYSGIHHIGFQVENASEMQSKLKNANSMPREDINTLLHSSMDVESGGRNVELKYTGPDGIMIDISQGGWIGAD